MKAKQHEIAWDVCYVVLLKAEARAAPPGDLRRLGSGARRAARRRGELAKAGFREGGILNAASG